MSFSEIAERLKKQREEQGGAPLPDRPVDFPELYTLRARILGLLIRDARLAKGCSVEDCAASLEISPQTLLAWELGEASPSLPQLELLSFELGVPVNHFWSTQTLTGNSHPDVLPQDEYLALRDRVVGASLRQARAAAELSVEELAEKTGIAAEKIQAYELGQAPVPLTELTSLASATNVSLRHFLDSAGRVGHWLALQEEFQRFSQMPEEIRAFVSNPVNASFIELAMWLSQLEVDDLRGLAESILYLSRLNAQDFRRIAEGILNNITL